MNLYRFNTVIINRKKYLWRDVANTIDDSKEHHYRVAELSLEKVYNANPHHEFFTYDYDPPVYFAPLSILEEDDTTVVEWCENHGMYFD